MSTDADAAPLHWRQYHLRQAALDVVLAWNAWREEENPLQLLRLRDAVVKLGRAAS